MKWTLIVMVFGSTPVETGIVFSTLSECQVAENSMRQSTAEAHNEWVQWAKRNAAEANYPASIPFMVQRNGLGNVGICIPSAGSRPGFN